MTAPHRSNELVSIEDDETVRDIREAPARKAIAAATAETVTARVLPVDTSAAEAVAAEAVAVEAAAEEAIAAETIAARAAAEIIQEADKTAALMIIAAKSAADKAAQSAQQTALDAAEVAAHNVSEVVQDAVVTAAAMVDAAITAAKKLLAATRAHAGATPTQLAEELAAHAASTAEAMVEAAAATAVRTAARARHDTEVAAQVATQAVADILQEASVTAQSMVTAAAAAATATAERAAERARHEAYARSQAELLHAVVDSIGDGVEVVGQDGSLLMHNRAAEQLGVRQKADNGIEGRPLGLFHPDGITEFPLHETPLARALAGESCDGVEILVRSVAHPHGVLLTVSGRPLSGGSGSPGAVAVYRDVTDERAHRTELEMFAAIAAHDLSSPLAIVIGYLDVITELVVPQLTHDTAPIVIDVLRRAGGSAARMSQLIDDLLRYAASDAVLAAEDFDLRALVNDVVAARTEHFKANTTTATFVIGDLPWVRGDRSRIAQVLNNLIGNALKYTVPGQSPCIEVTATLTSPEPGAEPQVDVQISDRGIGIPAGQHQAIFTNLYRAHPSNSYSGTGLGLAICARIVERHGGHIHADDNPGGGTRIHFTLPRADRPVDAVDCTPDTEGLALGR